MALANGISRIRTGPVTLHTKTAIHVAEQLTQVGPKHILIDFQRLNWWENEYSVHGFIKSTFLYQILSLFPGQVYSDQGRWRECQQWHLHHRVPRSGCHQPSFLATPMCCLPTPFMLTSPPSVVDRRRGTGETWGLIADTLLWRHWIVWRCFYLYYDLWPLWLDIQAN